MTGTSTRYEQTKQSQREQALALAQGVRSAVNQLRAEVGRLSEPDGRQLVAALLVHPDDTVGAIRVFALLTSISRIGDTRAKRLLHQVGGATTGKHVRDLSDRQRLRLAALLRGEAK